MREEEKPTQAELKAYALKLIRENRVPVDIEPIFSRSEVFNDCNNLFCARLGGETILLCALEDVMLAEEIVDMCAKILTNPLWRAINGQ